MKQHTTLLRRASLMALALAAGSAAWAQTAIPASFAHPRASVSEANRGFKVKVVQATSDAGTLPNSIERAEAQLAGILISPLTGTPFENVADLTGFNPDGTYTETSSIDYEVGGGSELGLTIPGITGDNKINIALEAVAYLDLDPGTYTMIVNSDDGFRVTVGSDARDQIGAIEVGKFDGGRGTTDTSFSFSVSAAGVYSFRLVYEQGDGGANVYWYAASSDEADAHVLVNADGGIKAYQSINGNVAPYVVLANPLPGATGVSPATTVNFSIVDGTPAKVNPASVVLTFDGVATGATATKVGSKTTVSFDPPGLLAVLSEHTVKLVFSDDSTPVNTRTEEYKFTAASFGAITLPPPLFLENFDEVAEGELATGWTQVNFTTGSTGDFDLDDPGSDSYLGWVTISSNRLWRIGQGELNHWDALRRFTTAEQYLNGQKVTSLVTNNFMYAESDQRGGSQVQYLFSKDYDLTGKTNIYLSYHSMYEQNQDSMGSVEYSIDGGTTWLPVVMMIDQDDIVKDEQGKTLGYETLIADQGDTAHYDDPDTGEAKGGHYGAFIGNQDTNTWSALAPFISGRVNDNSIESKRVEFFRLPKADNAKTVRLRFAQAGTGSWYFGIDDVGLYSITVVDPPLVSSNPSDLTVVIGQTAVLRASGIGAGVTYQWQRNQVDLDGETSATLTLTGVTAANEGKYRLKITNAGGVVNTTEATLTVAAPLTDLSSLATGLATHLKFDGNLSDSSGNNVGGIEVGTLTYGEGKVGTQAVGVKTGDGAFNYVSLERRLLLGNDDFSISFWAKLNSWADDPSFIGNKDWDSGGNVGFVVATDGDGHLQWNYKSVSGTRKDYDGPGGLFTAGVWRHVVVTFDRGGFITTYVNGQQVTDKAPLAVDESSASDTDSLALNIGQDGAGDYGPAIDALIDDVAIWRRALGVPEIEAIYRVGNTGKSFDEVPVSADVVFAPPVVAGDSLMLSWTGGTGPFLVQGKLGVNDAWIDLKTTAEHTATIPLVGFSGFFRVVDGTTKVVTLFKATLNGANERPTPVATSGTGTGLLALDGLSVTYVVSYSNLSGAPTAYHLHGLGSAEEAVGVKFALVPAGALSAASGLFAGQSTVDAATAAGIVAGQTYFNVHTTANGGGEIRGQVLP